MLFLETFTGHAEIDDGQKHEDERLDGADDEDVEDLPARQQDDPHRRQRGLDERRTRERRVRESQQVDHHEAAEDVAEKPECETQRLGDLLDDVEWREENPSHQGELERLGEAAQITAEAEDMDVVPLEGDDRSTL